MAGVITQRVHPDFDETHFLSSGHAWESNSLLGTVIQFLHQMTLGSSGRDYW